MKTIYDVPLDKIIELYNLITDSNDDLNEILSAYDNNENQLRNDLNDEIADTLLDKYNYDGDYEDFNAIYYFIKGVKSADAHWESLMNIQSQPLIKQLHIPHAPKHPKQPKKYIDSDTSFFNKLKRLPKINDPFHDFNRQQLQLKFNRDLHKRDQPFLSQLMQHQNDFTQFHSRPSNNDDEPIDELFTPKELNAMTIKSFKQWKEFNEKHKDEQQQIVNDIMEQLETSPTDWTIDFEQLNQLGRELMFPLLKQFFAEHIDSLPITSKYMIRYNVNGVWRSFPFKSENYNKLMNKFNEQSFIFDMDTKPPEYFYENGGEELPDWSFFSALQFTKLIDVDGNNDVGGSFFHYLVKHNINKQIIKYLQRLQIFDKLVNEDGKQRDELNDCCFIYALKQTGCYSENDLNLMRLRINNRYLSQSSINSICEEFHIKIHLTYINEDAKRKKATIQSCKAGKRKSFMGDENAKPNRTHTFNVYENHYFIEEKTPFSTYYIKHLGNAKAGTLDKELKDGKWRPARYFISSSNLVRELFKLNAFTPITYGQCRILHTVFYNEIDSDISNIDLEYNPKTCTQLIKPDNHKKKSLKTSRKDPTYWYADFEADVSGDIHKPFMCVLQSQNGKVNKEFHGENCNVQLLNFLPDNAVIYFHNLAYDIRMLAQFGITSSIIKGTKTMKADIRYNKKILHFKDSLPILSCKLSQLPQMFDIPNIQKEIFPYKYYTLERLSSNKGVINEAGLNEDKQWTDADYKLFNTNIDKIPNCRIDANHFDMWKYASFYCQQDVNILRLGFNAFRQGFIKDFNIDPFKYVSISSLANEVFNQRVYYPNKNLYKIGGHVRKFCSHAVYGGRCMTAYNKKWHTTKPLSDFDAVSLYPSAMARLYTVEGRPEVIKPNQLNLEFLSKQGAYIVEIKITKVNKHYPFPLIVRKDKGLNINDDNLAPGETVNMVVDNITLEDLIEFQKIEFELIRGYYWPGARDYRIQDEIRKIFNKRLEYKKQHNPLQQLYKLIMNSCYGKTIERPVEKDYKYFDDPLKLEKYWFKNYYKITDVMQIANSNIQAVRTLKPIDKHFNFSLLGIQVLSMSKRIMNEVMCLAYDLGCHIYYQDTDSFMIECPDLEILQNGFREKYNRELIGTNLGNFHCDFPSINNHDEMPYSVEAYFLMKKMYVHKITDSSNEIDYVIRGKGLTQNSIKYAAKGDYMKLYQSIFNGNTQSFDLTQGQPCFSMNKNMTVSTVKQFQRTIKTTYDEGNRDDYFTHT